LRAAVIVLALVAGAVAVRVWTPYVLEPRSALQSLRAMGESSQVLVFALAYLVLTTCAVPAALMNVVAGVAFGFWRGVLLAFVCANIVSNLQFWLGRAVGAERIAAWLERKGFSRYHESNEISSLVLLRAIPSPVLAVNMGCGAAGVKWRHFVLGSGLGLVAPSIVHTLFASQVYQGVEGAKLSSFLWAAGAGLCVVALSLVPRWLRNRKPAPP